MTESEFRKELISFSHPLNDLREGQSLFNKSWESYPDLVEKLSGTEYDCFYRDDRIDSFLEKLYSLYCEKFLEL